MGVSMRQECDRIAGAYEHQERQIEALQQALLEVIRTDNGCEYRKGCATAAAHPAPWHAEKCGCSCEARDLYVKILREIEAKTFV